MHAYRDRELEIQMGRMPLPLQELRTLLQAVFLGVEGQEVTQEAARLFDVLASLPLLPVPEASGGAGKVLGDDTPERLVYEGIVLSEDPEQLAASVEVVEGEQVVGMVLISAEVLELSGDGTVADVGLRLPREVARELARQLLAGADVGDVAGVSA